MALLIALASLFMIAGCDSGEKAVDSGSTGAKI